MPAELEWTRQAAFPILGVLQLLPLFGAVLVFFLRERPVAVVLGRAFAVAELLLAIQLYRWLDAASPALQFAERIGFVGYHAGADGVRCLPSLQKMPSGRLHCGQLLQTRWRQAANASRIAAVKAGVEPQQEPMRSMPRSRSRTACAATSSTEAS
jgi:hypothetical protein